MLGSSIPSGDSSVSCFCVKSGPNSTSRQPFDAARASCRLPGFNEARGVLRPKEEEREPPLLVALQEGAADQPAVEEGRTR